MPPLTLASDPGNRMTPDRSGSSLRPTRLDLLVLAIVAVLGLVNLHQPFTWDQAMFTTAAERLAHGGRPYVDMWDTKQPGIFLFYWLGGSLFGFSEAGIHLFELLVMLAFAWTLIVMLRGAFERRWVASLAALLVVGQYFAIAEDWHLTQVESLVPFPLFVALACGARAAAGGRWRALFAFVAGLAAGAVLVFKLALLPLLAAFWLVDLVSLLRGPAAGRVRSLLVCGSALVAGVLVATLPVVAWLAAAGTLGIARWTWFDFPVRFISQLRGLRIRRLLDGVAWFARGWAPLIALAVIPVWQLLRGRRDGLVVRLLAWIAAGLFAILIQRFSYWQYHFLLIAPPVAILAALAIDRLWPALRSLAPERSGREVGAVFALALALLSHRPLVAAATKAAFLARDGFGLSAAGREREHVRWSRGGGYARFAIESQWVTRPDARPGPIVVVGHPLVYWMARREAAAPRVIPDFLKTFTAEEWGEIAARVARVKPPYVYVSNEDGLQVEEARPRTDAWLALLAADYRPAQLTPRGRWYERVAP